MSRRPTMTREAFDRLTRTGRAVVDDRLDGRRSKCQQ